MLSITHDAFNKVFPSFKTTAGPLVDHLLLSSSIKEFAQGAFLYHEGDRCPGIAFVLSGEIRVYKIGESGREITLYEIFPGETCILNASCILARQNYPANAMALTNGTMLYLPQNIFLEFMAEFEQMRLFIFALFSRRFNEIIELIETVTFGKMDLRLTDYLIEKSEEDQLQSTHQKIAYDLGTSREVVSRLLKDLEKKGKIALSRNHIRLIDLQP